jgi:hydroxyacylglutathione hydrolase
MLGFGGGHIPGAMNLGASPELSIWAGWILDPERPILLVLDEDAAIEKVVPLFLRTGFTTFAGYLAGGMTAWDNVGFSIVDTPQLTVHQIKDRQDELQVVDVRSPSEWHAGHIPGAKHIFLPELAERHGEIDASRPVAVHCASGYRASLAASILLKEGFQNVANIPGSWLAWQKAGYPIEK